MTNGGGLGGRGSKKENSNSAIFQNQEGSFNYIVVALQFVICDKNKWEIDRREKNSEIKCTIGITNHTFLSNTIPPPVDDPSILFYIPFLFRYSHSHEAIPIATLKITCNFFLFFLCNLEVHDNNSSVKHPIQNLDFFFVPKR